MGGVPAALRADVVSCAARSRPQPCKAGAGGATSSRVECSICVTRPCSALQALLDGTGGGALPSDATLAFDAWVA